MELLFTIEKNQTLLLDQNLWNFDLLLKKTELCYLTETYGTLIYYFFKKIVTLPKPMVL